MRDAATATSSRSTCRCSTSDGDRVRHVGAFFEPALFATFGLPDRLPADSVPAGARPCRRRGPVTGPSAGRTDRALELLERAAGLHPGRARRRRRRRPRRPDALRGLDPRRPAARTWTTRSTRSPRPPVGRVDLAPRPPPARAPASTALQDKACALLGALERGRARSTSPSATTTGALRSLLAAAAALEIAVHGWDVGQATGAAPDLPTTSPAALLPVAQAVVLPEDRPDRFAAPRRPGRTAGSADVLLGFLGRVPIRPVGPGIHIWDKVPRTPPPSAPWSLSCAHARTRFSGRWLAGGH